MTRVRKANVEVEVADGEGKNRTGLYHGRPSGVCFKVDPMRRSDQLCS